LVRALLDDPTAVEHDELIHARDRAQPVRDHQRGPALHKPPERLLDAFEYQAALALPGEDVPDIVGLRRTLGMGTGE
jgi:hypothetical protein